MDVSKFSSGRWTEVPVFSGAGRVGHTVDELQVDGKDGLVVVGGANGVGPFADAHFYCWESSSWRVMPWEGLTPRYEHCSFVNRSSSTPRLFVFGGGQQNACLNSVYGCVDGKWTESVVRGMPPCPRTYHASASAVCHGNNVFVFGGGTQGASGAAAVEDQRVHVLSLDTMTWCQPRTFGDSPQSRHGHAVAVAGDTLYIHGGLAGVALFDDLWALDLKSHHWSSIHTKGNVPCARAAHAACASGDRLFIHGGMTTEGVLGDLCVLNLGTTHWSSVKVSGKWPPARCDHALCLVEVATDTAPAASAERVCAGDDTAADSAVAEPASTTEGEAVAAADVSTAAGDDVVDGESPKIVTLLAPQEEPSEPGRDPASLFPHVDGQKQSVLCVLGGMDITGKMHEDFYLMKLTPS